MWLINTETLELEQFANHPQNKYAILSHRWEENEATFQNWVARKDLEGKGSRKIMRFVQEAARRGFVYAWADTCCINKESSAELSEAINSMFKYYEHSAECYVYLSDLFPFPDAENERAIISSDELTSLIELYTSNSFVESKWFTRGWTLQELIAPRTVYFFDSDWQFYGTKRGLKGQIEHVTGIPESILDGSQHVQNLSIACRMSWAANRKTTRIEDMAYSLLGIFGINMPLLYGEGQEAFIRLQEEICKKTTDMSLFAWKMLYPDELYSGLLARSPLSFRDSASVDPFSAALQTDFGDEIAVTNRGIRFDNMPLHISSQYGVLLDLECWTRTDKSTRMSIYVCLSRTPRNWVRHKPNELVFLDASDRAGLRSLEMSRVFIQKTVDPGILRSSDLFSHSMVFHFSPGITLISAEPSNLWHLQGFLPNRHLLGAIHISTRLERRRPEEFLVLCGISPYDAEGKEILDWRQRYSFRALGQRHADFRAIKELVRRKRLTTREGCDEFGHYFRKYARESCWNTRGSFFINDTAKGTHHRISVRGQVRSKAAPDGDSWDVADFHIVCEQIDLGHK